MAMRKLGYGVGVLLLLCSAAASAQDVASFGLKFIQVLAEDDKARVLKYTPHAGDKSVHLVLPSGNVDFTRR